MKWFLAALAVLVLILQYRIWASPGGVREVTRLDDAVAAQRAENEKLTARNQQLSAEVRDLKQGFQAVEERARSELGLIAPNETYYQVVPPENSPPDPAAHEVVPEAAPRWPPRRAEIALRYWLVMPAAGSGRRFGGGQPKQYQSLAGAALIEHALAPFIADARCRQLVVALDAHDEFFGTLAVSRDPRVRAVHGGARRCDSVRLALAALDGADEDWVLVHDAARPCLPTADLDALIDALAQDAVGGLLATPLADTLKRADAEQRVADTPPRTSLWRALTPQMFRLGALRMAMAAAEAAGREPTDEAQALEWLGHAPRLVAGSPANVKVTTPADLRLAAAWLAQENGA